MKHVIFIAPHFPANQRQFVRALKQIGCRVTGIIDVSIDYVDSETKGYLDDFEEVPSVTSLDHVAEAVRKIQKRGPWDHHLEASVELTCSYVQKFERYVVFLVCPIQ